jgi:cob(I)alamin adenosyltransferase
MAFVSVAEWRVSMPKLTRIYTRTGDDGTTGLVGGQRVKKNALRIEAYGTIDELSSVIGLARTALTDVLRTRPVQDIHHAHEVAGELDAWLAWTQDALFNLGSDLATLPGDRWEGMPLIGAADATALERAIDRAQHDLEPLANFILPGGSYPGAFLHQARTVCRRAERLLFTLRDSEPITADVLRYVNRLSDALFVWSRWINHALEQPESLWNAKTGPPGAVTASE